MVIDFNEALKNKQYKLVEKEVEIALNIFNEATEDLVEPAIHRYNEALNSYEALFGKKHSSIN